MQIRFRALDHHGVSGIVAALEADDHVHFISQNVNDFSFSFITPLGSDDDISSHNCIPTFLYYGIWF